MNTVSVHSHGPRNNLSSWFFGPLGSSMEKYRHPADMFEMWPQVKQVTASERSVWVFSSPKYKLKSLKKCGFWQPDSEPRGLMRQIVSHICKYGNKNYTVYPPPVLTSQNSTASFPNNTVTPHFFQPKYPEVETTVSFSLPFIIITHSLPLGNTKEECFAVIVQKGAPACCMWVRGSSHPSGTAERMGEVGVQWNTEQRSYLMGEERQNHSLILTSNLCKLLESERENLIETHNGVHR